jgi:hypothetical protein
MGEGEGGGESRIHPPPLYPLPRGEGIFLNSEKKILRLKGVRIYAFSATVRGKSGFAGIPGALVGARCIVPLRPR